MQFKITCAMKLKYDTLISSYVSLNETFICFPELNYISCLRQSVLLRHCDLLFVGDDYTYMYTCMFRFYSSSALYITVTVKPNRYYQSNRKASYFFYLFFLFRVIFGSA